jgi:streptogramin lyase
MSWLGNRFALGLAPLVATTALGACLAAPPSEAPSPDAGSGDMLRSDEDVAVDVRAGGAADAAAGSEAAAGDSGGDDATPPESGSGGDGTLSGDAATPLAVGGLALLATQGLPVTGPIALVTDANASETPANLSAVIDWGDGSPTSMGTVSGASGSFTVASTHTFDRSGSLTARLTVSSTGGAQAAAMIAVTVQAPYTTMSFTIPTASCGVDGITAGPDGNLWFTEVNANKIGRLTTSGSFSEFSIPTANANPYVIAPGPDGNLWFDEPSGLGRITPTGTIAEFALASGSAPYGIVSGPGGNLWTAEYGTGKIGEMSPAGTIVDEFSGFNDTGGPAGIAVGTDGNLWVTEYSGNTVDRVTSAGALKQYTIPTAMSQPNLMTAGPDGNLWFVEVTGDAIGRITTAGVITEFQVPSPGGNPIVICAGPDGSLWFNLQAKSGYQIGRVTPTGAFTEFPIANAGTGITTGPDDNVWFVDGADNQIVRLTP